MGRLDVVDEGDFVEDLPMQGLGNIVATLAAVSIVSISNSASIAR